MYTSNPSTATLNDNVVGNERIADYTLFHLNLTRNFSYVDFFGLQAPCDHFKTFGLQLAKSKGMVKGRKDLATGNNVGWWNHVRAHVRVLDASCQSCSSATSICRSSGRTQLYPDWEDISQSFVRAFREGKLGVLNLDQDILDEILAPVENDGTDDQGTD